MIWLHYVYFGTLYKEVWNILEYLLQYYCFFGCEKIRTIQNLHNQLKTINSETDQMERCRSWLQA